MPQISEENIEIILVANNIARLISERTIWPDMPDRTYRALDQAWDFLADKIRCELGEEALQDLVICPA